MDATASQAIQKHGVPSKRVAHNSPQVAQQ